MCEVSSEWKKLTNTVKNQVRWLRQDSSSTNRKNVIKEMPTYIVEKCKLQLMWILNWKNNLRSTFFPIFAYQMRNELAKTPQHSLGFISFNLHLFWALQSIPLSLSVFFIYYVSQHYSFDGVCYYWLLLMLHVNARERERHTEAKNRTFERGNSMPWKFEVDGINSLFGTSSIRWRELGKVALTSSRCWLKTNEWI